MNEQKIINIISDLNSECLGLIGENYDWCPPFEFYSCGYVSGVRFLSVPIWDTENYSMYDDDDKEIDLEKFLRDEANGVLNNLKEIKL